MSAVRVVTVLYFAIAEDLRGCAEERLELPAAVRTIGEFAAHLEVAYPALQGALHYMRIARNEQFADAAEAIAHGDTLALIPPVAGG